MADRNNHRLNVLIEDHIRQWDGTVHGQSVKNMYDKDYMAINEREWVKNERKRIKAENN